MSAAAFRGTNAWRWPAQVAFGTNVPIPSGEGKGVAAGKGGRRKGQQREKYLSAPTSRITAFAPGVGSSGQAAAGMPQLEQLEPENADDARANAERHVGGV